ncbi:MAG TPA: DUF2304 domain-containing protein [Solirubrobacteraceae bacterium]|jgi:hypothetical protein|nr:DUF2304 domain-containing protein [Solirubrobacteraceae bacterium]
MGTQRIIAIAISGGMLLLILELVRRKRLMERYALLWLFSTLLLLVLSLWSGLLNSLASALGVSYPPSALFAVAFGVVLVLLVHFSLAVSHLSDQNKVLAQRLGILQRQVQEQNEHLSTLAQGDALKDAPLGEGARARDREQLTPTS